MGTGTESTVGRQMTQWLCPVTTSKEGAGQLDDDGQKIWTDDMEITVSLQKLFLSLSLSLPVMKGKDSKRQQKKGNGEKSNERVQTRRGAWKKQGEVSKQASKHCGLCDAQCSPLRAMSNERRLKGVVV